MKDRISFSVRNDKYNVYHFTFYSLLCTRYSSRFTVHDLRFALCSLLFSPSASVSLSGH